MISADADDRVLQTEQVIERTRSEVFSFFADPRNLEAITPPWLRFKIVGQTTPEVAEGTELTYRLRLRGFPIKWKSVIAEWEPGVRFVDVQLRGPYAKWHHTHTFEDTDGGTLIRDRVLYRLPLGAVGRLVAGTFVDRDVDRIFRFRRNRMAELLA